jgi:hypothetical protein
MKDLPLSLTRVTLYLYLLLIFQFSFGSLSGIHAWDLTNPTGQNKSFLLFLKCLKGPIKSWPTKNDRKRYAAVVYYTLCAYPGPVTMPA